MSLVIILTFNKSKQWILKKEEVMQNSHKRDKEELKLNNDEIELLTIYHSMSLNFTLHSILGIPEVGKELKLRQRVVATAVVYFRRFYSKYYLTTVISRHNFMEFCPLLVGPTCLYIATKVEECNSQATASKFEVAIKKAGVRLLPLIRRSYVAL